MPVGRCDRGTARIPPGAEPERAGTCQAPADDCTAAPCATGPPAGKCPALPGRTTGARRSSGDQRRGRFGGRACGCPTHSGSARSPRAGERAHQSRESRPRGAGQCPPRPGAGRDARVSRQGPERGRRHCSARGREPEHRTGLRAVSQLTRAAAGTDRCPRPRAVGGDSRCTRKRRCARACPGSASST